MSTGSCTANVIFFERKLLQGNQIWFASDCLKIPHETPEMGFTIDIQSQQGQGWSGWSTVGFHSLFHHSGLARHAEVTGDPETPLSASGNDYSSPALVMVFSFWSSTSTMFSESLTPQSKDFLLGRREIPNFSQVALERVRSFVVKLPGCTTSQICTATICSFANRTCFHVNFEVRCPFLNLKTSGTSVGHVQICGFGTTNIAVAFDSLQSMVGSTLKLMEFAKLRCHFVQSQVYGFHAPMSWFEHAHKTWAIPIFSDKGPAVGWRIAILLRNFGALAEMGCHTNFFLMSIGNRCQAGLTHSTLPTSCLPRNILEALTTPVGS